MSRSVLRIFLMLALAFIALAPAARAESAAEAVAPGLKALEDSTGMTFTVPNEMTRGIVKDGEVQLVKGDDLFVVLGAGQGAQATFDKGMAILKAIGKDSFKQEDDTRSKEQDGVKMMAAHGTLQLDGKTQTWALVVMDGGGSNVLRVVAIGNDVLKDPTMDQLGNSIKKK